MPRGEFRFANPAFLKIAGYEEEELLGADSLTLVFPEDRDKVRKYVLEVLKGGIQRPVYSELLPKTEISAGGLRRLLLSAMKENVHSLDILWITPS